MGIPSSILSLAFLGMTTWHTVCCDLDGVLCDFNRGVERVCHRPPASMRPADMWKQLARSREPFYETLRWAAGGRELWQALAGSLIESGTVRLCVLTGVPLGDWAAPQKARWCERELLVPIRHVPKAGQQSVHRDGPASPAEPGTVDVITCWSKNKHFEASHGCVLIDDTFLLREAWVRAGGEFVHHTNTAATLERLRALGVLGREQEADLPAAKRPKTDACRQVRER